MSRGCGEGKAAHTHTPQSASTPVADYNVLCQPCSLLLIVLNVALNVLPMLALRTIHRTVWKRRPKVRESWGMPSPPQTAPQLSQTLCPGNSADSSLGGTVSSLGHSSSGLCLVLFRDQGGKKTAFGEV